MWILKKYYKVILVCLVLAVLIISAFMQLEIERTSQIREQQQFDNTIVTSKANFYKVIGDRKIEEVKDKKEGKDKIKSGKDETTDIGTDGKYPGQTDVKENNGKLMVDPFSIKCSVPPTYKCDYFDFAIPYDCSPDELGGWMEVCKANTNDYPSFANTSGKRAAGRKTKFFTKMSGKVQPAWGYMGLNMGQSCKERIKGAKGRLTFQSPPYGGPGSALVNSNGTRVCLIAIANPLIMKEPKINKLRAKFFSVPGEHSKAYPLFDIILKDGTVIHCACYDTGANQHVLGGVDSLHEYPRRPAGVASAWMWGKFAKMKAPQYAGMCFGNEIFQFFELAWNDAGKDTIGHFVRKFDLLNNKPAFIRVYDGYAGIVNGKTKMPALSVPKWKGISSNGVW